MFKVKQGLILVGVIGALLLLATQSFALPFGYSSKGNDLYEIDLDSNPDPGIITPSMTLIGPVGFDDVEALAFNPVTGILYGIDDESSSSSFESLISINTLTGAGTLIGSLGFAASNPGLAISSLGIAYMSHDPNSTANDVIRRIDLATGLTEEIIGPTGVNGIDGLTFLGDTLYGISGFGGGSGLYTIDLVTGHATEVFLNSEFSGHMGLASDGTNMYAISSDSNIFAIDLSANTADESFLFGGSGFEGLAIQPAVTPTPEPGTLLLFGSGLVGLIGWRWQKRKKNTRRL